MAKRWSNGVLIICLFASMLQAQDRASVLQTLNESPNLSPVSPPVNYDVSMLDEFDRELAPQLRLYGVRGVTVQRWMAQNEAAEVALLEMSDSAAAYGIFTSERASHEGIPTPTLIGAGSFRYRDQLYFWQSNYVVRIKGMVLLQDQLSGLVSRNILGRSRKPPVSEFLPPLNLTPGSERYVLSPDAIDPRAGIDPNKLGFDSSAEAATASYSINGNRANLLLVLYPTQHIAKKYTEDLQADHSIATAFSKRAGPLLAVVYGTPNTSIAASLLDNISHEFKVTWNEPEPGLALGPMLMTIFTFIGIALLFTTIVGLSYGGLRVFVKAKFPNRVFDRPETMELIQLKLIQGFTDRQIKDGSSRTES